MKSDTPRTIKKCRIKKDVGIFNLFSARIGIFLNHDSVSVKAGCKNAQLADKQVTLYLFSLFYHTSIHMLPSSQSDVIVVEVIACHNIYVSALDLFYQVVAPLCE